MHEVELSVTVWERTWDETLRPDFFDRITSSLGRKLDSTTITINNVTDLPAVVARADNLARAGVLDSYVTVARSLPDALRQTGLSPRLLAPLPFYTDHFLVKMCQPGPRWLVHWDTDVTLVPAGDWITPSVEFLAAHPNVVVAGPGWTDDESMNSETLMVEGPFNIGYGFTDQVFVVDRSRFAAPIYRYFSPASWWYGSSHLTPIFEQRVDAWMRRNRFMRATYRDVRYIHDEIMAAQPSGGLYARVRRKVQGEIFHALQQSSLTSPVLRR